MEDNTESWAETTFESPQAGIETASESLQAETESITEPNPRDKKKDSIIKTKERSWKSRLRQVFKFKKKSIPDAAVPPASTEKDPDPKLDPEPDILEASTAAADPAGLASTAADSTIQGLDLDEHKIDGLRSTRPENSNGGKSAERDPNLSNVHTLFFSGSCARPGFTKTNLQERRRCLPRSPKSDKEALRSAEPDVKSRKGCFPQLGRKRSVPTGDGELKVSLTYLNLDDEGNYGSMIDSGYHPKQLTYLDFEKDGRYEPSVQDNAMTYLDVDDEGKYESSVERRRNDPSAETLVNRIGWGGGGLQAAGTNPVYRKSSVTPLESDEKGMDVFLTPPQTISYSNFQLHDPPPLTRMARVPDNFLNFRPSDINDDDSSDDGEQDNGMTHPETSYGEKCSKSRNRGCLTKRVKKGPLKTDSLKEAFTCIELDKTQQDPSSTDAEATDPSMLANFSKTQQKQKRFRKFRNGCLGRRNRKKSPRDISYGEYSVDVEVSDPWRGEQVAESELKEFRRSKPKWPPFGRKLKMGKENSVTSNESSEDDTKLNEPGMEDEEDEPRWEDSSDHKLKENGCLPFKRKQKRLDPDTLSTESDERSDFSIDFRLQFQNNEDDGAGTQLESIPGRDTTNQFPPTNLIGIESESNSSDCSEIFASASDYEKIQDCKPKKGCLPFGRKQQQAVQGQILNPPDSSETLITNLAYDSGERPLEAIQMPWEDSSATKSKKGCIPFARKAKSAYPDENLTSVQAQNRQLNEPLLQVEVVETPQEGLGERKHKKKCLLVGRRSEDHPGSVLTSVVTDGANNGAISVPSQDDNSPGQVRVDVEGHGTEGRRCLSFPRRSRKGKLLVNRSGEEKSPNTGSDFGQGHPLLEKVDESIKGFNSGRERHEENSTQIKHIEQGTLGRERRPGDLPHAPRFACADRLFAAKKQTTNYAHLPASDPESMLTPELTAPTLDASKAHKGICGLSRKRPPEGGSETFYNVQTQPYGGAERGQAADRPEPGRTGCGKFLMKRYPTKKLLAMQTDGQSGYNTELKAGESAEEKISSLYATNDYTDRTPLINNGAQRGFKGKCFPCIDKTRASSKVIVEAGILPPGVKDVLYRTESRENTLAVETSRQALYADTSDELALQELAPEENISCGKGRCLVRKQDSGDRSRAGCGMNPLLKHLTSTREQTEFSDASLLDPRTQQTVEDDERGYEKLSTQRCFREKWISRRGKDLVERLLEDGFSASVNLSDPSDQSDRFRWFPSEEEDPIPHSCHTFRPRSRPDIPTLEVDLIYRTTDEDLANGKLNSVGPTSIDSTDKYVSNTISDPQSKFHTQKCPENKWLRRMEPLAEQPKDSTEELQDNWLEHDELKSRAQDSKPFVRKPKSNWPTCCGKFSFSLDYPTSNDEYPDTGLLRNAKEPGTRRLRPFQPCCFGDGRDRDKETDSDSIQAEISLHISQPSVQAEISASNLDSGPTKVWQIYSGQDSAANTEQALIEPSPERHGERTLPRVAENQTQTEFSNRQTLPRVAEYQTPTESSNTQVETGTSPSQMEMTSYGDKQMESNPDPVRPTPPYERLENYPEQEYFEEDQIQVGCSHKCLGKNWQKRQKNESVAQALEASETLLKKPTPIKHPEFESSGQEESSMASFPLQKKACCPMNVFLTKDKTKSKRTQTKDSQTRVVSFEQGNDQQIKGETANNENDQSQLNLNSAESSEIARPKGSGWKKLRRATGARRIRHSSPVGTLDSDQKESSVLDDESPSVHKKPKREDRREETSQTLDGRYDNEKSNEDNAHVFGVVHRGTSPTLAPPRRDSLQQKTAIKSTASRTVQGDLGSRGIEDSSEDKSAPRQNITSDSHKQQTGQSRRASFASRDKNDEDSKAMHQSQPASGGILTLERKLQIKKKISYVEPSTSPTEDSSSSSSGEDRYDIASREFRDTLFKNKPRHSKASTSQEQLIEATGANGLDKFDSINDFQGSSVFKELVRVECQMKEIARIISGIAGPEYQKSNTRSQETEADSNRSKLGIEDETSLDSSEMSAQKKSSRFANWQESISIPMASRLAGDEVPVYYDKGFKVGYIPVEDRGNAGMRKKPTGALDREYHKFDTDSNVDVIAMDEEDDTDEPTHPRMKGREVRSYDATESEFKETTTEYASKTAKRKARQMQMDAAYDALLPKYSRRRFSEKFTAKGLLHEKLHPHDHRNSLVPLPPPPPRPIAEYSSSSSSWSWKEDLIKSHRRSFCRDKEVLDLRKKKPFESDSDSSESSDEPECKRPDRFLIRVDEELKRLKVAKSQAAARSRKHSSQLKASLAKFESDTEEDSCSDNPTTRDRTAITVKKPAKNSADFGRQRSIQGTLRLGWKGSCGSPPESRDVSPSKKQRAVKNRDSKLSEKGVQKDFKRKQQMILDAKPTKSSKMNKLHKERCKMEQQTRVLAQAPKGERKEIEQLRASLVEERDMHRKKELNWRQTSNRLRGVNDELKNQIKELRKEIGRHESRLFEDLKLEECDSDDMIQPFKEKVRFETKQTNIGSDNPVQDVKKSSKMKNSKDCPTEVPEEQCPSQVRVEVVRNAKQPTLLKFEISKKTMKNDALQTREARNNTKSSKNTTITRSDDTTRALAQKMEHLEEEVEQWIHVHTQQGVCCVESVPRPSNVMGRRKSPNNLFLHARDARSSSMCGSTAIRRD